MMQNNFQDKRLYISAAEHLFTCEHSLTLRINRVAQQQFTCSPAQLTELCLGWLRGEGYIRTTQDAETLTISADGHVADVTLRSPEKREPLPFAAPAQVDDGLCRRAADILLRSDTVHSRTRGTHGCVFVSGAFCLLCEDIGRNNALDKLAGSLLLQGQSPEEGLLFSSGRVTAEIVKKAVQMGFPVLVTKAAVTAEAVEAAGRYRLCLAFFSDGENYCL